jgi:hypothetical protein
MAFTIGFSLMPISEVMASDNNHGIISAFDEENIKTKQYGASQRDFSFDADKLVKDYLMWNEMQKYYPVEKFTSPEEAAAFYKSYFNIIAETGCGYAAACDVVFKYFEGREEDFLKAFGYPMYTYNNGVIDFNYELFILEFFNYCNLKMKDRYDEVRKVTKKDMYRFAFDEYVNSEEYKRRKPSKMTDEEYDAWEKFDNERIAKYKYLYDRWDSCHNTKINFGIPVDAAFGYIDNFLATKGLLCNSHVEFDNVKYKVGDIVAAGGYHLYTSEEQKENETAFNAVLTQIGDHYVYITEIHDDKIIVSSFGNRYILDLSTATWKENVTLKIGER